MNEQFNFNLCRVLAHTLVFEKQEEERAAGVPAGYFRNDSPSPPPAPNYAKQTSDTLSAQIGLAPSVLAANQQFSPAYTALDLSNLETSLLGSPGVTTSQTVYDPVTEWVNSLTGLTRNTDPTPSVGWGPGTPLLGRPNGTGQPTGTWNPTTISQPRTVTSTTPATPGFLDIYDNQILPALTKGQDTARSTQAGATVNDIATLGPLATAAFKSANPGGSALSDMLTKTATDQLALGTTLDPHTVGGITKSVSTNWANRGLGGSDPAQLDQAVQLALGGQNLLQSREANASSVAGQDYSETLAPLAALLGQPITSVGSAPNVTGTAGGLVGSVPGLNPESSYAGNLNDTAYNAQAAANISGANSTDSLIGSGIGAAGLAAALIH
jgi:hypothetical protein